MRLDTVLHVAYTYLSIYIYCILYPNNVIYFIVIVKEH